MISIIFPTLNEGKVLTRTLNSIFSQTVKDIEVIVVNDTSTDNTDEVIKPFLNRITYIKNEKNIDKQASRNKGIAVSRGEYILICDADIVMRHDMLEKLLNALEQCPECAFAYSAFKWEWKTCKSFPFDLDRLKKMNYINMAALVRRKDHPGFDESIGKFQDWDVWLTICLKGGKGYYVPDVLFSVGENLNRSVRKGLSRWLPKFMYWIPWHRFGIHIQQIEKYEKWKKIVLQKHGIE